ncbi:SusD/RagB family nutrient-binding outer membrane lipoprotein [Flavihumibacter petaseus]|uniref:SusD/RagB family protein n=1 Tax=Flavihumibacter petaseus NBRC 106054 TaxID=1220578 RepID=A0A0E9N101_9BACT|nr:SusD/RagB family nutrient-binding outer membrane lipoprotein [Flavihumibacter petaseus]GAO43692.1 hypothetical protein FPE01S_02_07980 [Flavihumibacter petaseus NBRC 106054]
MKAINKFIFTASLAGVLMVAGCTKDFESLNTDRNAVTSEVYIPVYNLTRAQLEYTGNSDFSYETWRVNIIYCGMMMQQLANTSWYAGDKYLQNDGWASSYFDVAYRDQVKYVSDLIEITKDNPLYANLHQIGRIIRVMIMHRITDLYGDVPYSQAGRGYYDRVFTPLYDTQEAIYDDMLKELESAAAALDPAGDQPGPGDLIYKGHEQTIEKYKKLAYSLMLRLGMRLTRAKPDAARAWVEKAAAGGVILSNTDNAFILHDESGGRSTVNRNSNILAGEWSATTNGEVFISQTFVDFMKDNNDPRLQWIGKVKSTGSSALADQIGMPNGYDQNGTATDIKNAPDFPDDINNYTTIRADILLSLSGPTFLVTAAQSNLLLAEAAQLGWSVGGDAATYYRNGVKASMQQLVQYNTSAVITDAQADAYLTAHPYDGANGVEQISTQYWAANFLDWYETFANWRRTGYPELVPVNYIGNATGGQIPRRMVYPSAEASANGQNLQEAISRQGANTMTTKVWWDK